MELLYGKYDPQQFTNGIEFELKTTDIVEKAVLQTMNRLDKDPEYYKKKIEGAMSIQNMLQRMNKATGGHKYINRMPHPNPKPGRKYIYFYTSKQVKEYKESGKLPDDGKTDDKKGGVLSGIMSFFGFKDEKKAQEKAAETYKENKDSLKGVDLPTFTDYLDEYLSNKDKWDKKLSKKSIITKDKETGEVKKKSTTDKKSVEKVKGKAWNLSLMRKIAGVVDIEMKTPDEGTIDKYKKEFSKLSPSELKDKLKDAQQYNEIEKIAAIEDLQSESGKISMDDLSSIGWDAWDLTGAESGGEIRGNDKKAKQFAEHVFKELDKKGITSLPKDFQNKLENENEHLLNMVLSLGLYYGEAEQMKSLQFINGLDDQQKKNYGFPFPAITAAGKGFEEKGGGDEGTLREKVENLSDETKKLAKEERNEKTGEMSQKYYDTLTKLNEAKRDLNSFLDKEQTKKLNSPESKEQKKKDADAQALKEKVKQKERDVTSTTYERSKKRLDEQIDEKMASRGGGIVGGESPTKENFQSFKNKDYDFKDFSISGKGIIDNEGEKFRNVDAFMKEYAGANDQDNWSDNDLEAYNTLKRAVGEAGKESPKKEKEPTSSKQKQYDELKKKVDETQKKMDNVTYYRDWDISINKDGKIVDEDYGEFNTAEDIINEMSGSEKKDWDDHDKDAYNILKEAQDAHKKLQKLKDDPALMGPKMFKALLDAKLEKLQKAKAEVGETRTRKDGATYKKMGPGKWEKVKGGKSPAEKPGDKPDDKKDDKKKEKKEKLSPETKSTIKSAAKKIISIFTDALSGQGVVAQTGAAAEEVGENISAKQKQKAKKENVPVKPVEPKKPKEDKGQK